MILGISKIHSNKLIRNIKFGDSQENYFKDITGKHLQMGLKCLFTNFLLPIRAQIWTCE